MISTAAPKIYTTPGGVRSALCSDALAQPHLLIAGATGSGKSVFLNSLIHCALLDFPGQRSFVLIDPKRVELVQYRDLPHTAIYASEPDEILRALCSTVDYMERIYQDMQARGLREYDGGHLYVIVDEFADLMTTQKWYTLPLLIRLAQLGRAAHVHLILATQRPTRDIVTGQIKVNLDARMALRCPTAQDSRNIINVKGAETLPRHGYGYYLTPDTMRPVLLQIPFTPEGEIAKRIAWWVRQK